MGGSWHRPVAIKGWTHVVFRREHDGARRVRSLDDMLEHLDAWDRTAERRARDRRRTRASRGQEERRVGERREPVEDTQERRREADAGSVASATERAGAALSASDRAPVPAPVGKAPTPGRDDAPFVIITRTS